MKTGDTVRLVNIHAWWHGKIGTIVDESNTIFWFKVEVEGIVNSYHMSNLEVMGCKLRKTGR